MESKLKLKLFIISKNWYDIIVVIFLKFKQLRESQHMCSHGSSNMKSNINI